MFPHIQYTKEQWEKLISISSMGELVVLADALSMELFETVQREKATYAIEGISQDVLNTAIRLQNFTGIPLDKQQQFLSFASDRQQYKRAIIYDVINDEHNTLSLESAEAILIKGFCSIAPLFDQLFIEWRERVVFSETGKMFALDPNSATEFRQKHGLSVANYVYSVIKEENGTYTEEPLVRAFPTLIKRITDELQKLNEALLLADADAEYIDYFNGFVDLLTNDDPTKYEFFSKNLDALWLQLEGRAIPVHPMEVYEDPGRYIVEPELSLEFLDDRYGRVNMGIVDTKKKMIDYLGKRYNDVEAYHASLPLIHKAQAGVYIAAVEGAKRLCMKPMGFNVPNWMEVRQTVGVRIFISMQTAGQRWIGERLALVKVFGEDTIHREYDTLAQSGKLDEYAGIVAVGGHEIAHNAFLKNDVQERLTSTLFANCEEAKASFTILSAIDPLYSEEEQAIVVKQELGYAVMKMQQIHEDSVIAYVNFSKAYLNACFASGIITYIDAAFSLHFEKDVITTFIKKLKEACDALVEVYDHGDSASAKAYVEKYFTPQDGLSALIEKVNSA